MKTRPMRYAASGTVAALTCLALVLSNEPAIADDGSPQTSADVAGALADAGVATGSSVPTTADADSAVTTTVGGATVDVPRDGGEDTTVTVGGETIGFALPGAEDSTAKKVGSDATAYVSDDGSAQVANVTGTREMPALQFLTTIAGPEAPTEYRYDLDLPSGTSLKLGADQSLSIVDEAGEVLTMAPAPWLKDANGTEIAGGASFRLDGDAVVLEVDVDRVEAFPATADPLWVLVPAAVWAVVRTVLVRCGVGAAEGVAASLLFGRRALSELVRGAAEGCVWGNLWGPAKQLVRRR